LLLLLKITTQPEKKIMLLEKLCVKFRYKRKWWSTWKDDKSL